MSKTVAQLEVEIATLYAVNAKLKEDSDKAVRARMSMKVGEKGGMSLYGLGRYPVTLYEEQWNALLGMAEDIRAFLKEQKALGNLQTPEQKVAAQALAKAVRAAAQAAKSKEAPSI